MRKFKIKVNSKEYIVEVEELKDDEIKVEKPKPEKNNIANEVKVHQREKLLTGTTVKSPMSGNIVKVNCNIGDEVKRGQVLFLLEAMKMENEITSPKQGKIKNILVSNGLTVKNKQPLLEFEE